MVLSGEERLAVKHLGKDTACTPNVDLDIVFLPCEHDLGGAVVSCGDVACHLGILNAGKTEITNLEVTVFVDENIAGLQVAVDDAGRVHIFETPLKPETGQYIPETASM